MQDPVLSFLDQSKRDPRGRGFQTYRDRTERVDPTTSLPLMVSGFKFPGPGEEGTRQEDQ